MPLRHWRDFRVGIFTAIVLVHVFAVYGAARLTHDGIPFWAAVWAIGLFLSGNLSITVGYHRFWTHETFQMKRWLQYIVAFNGGQTAQGSIKDWTKNHRQHHAYTDIPGDPHTPNLPSEGFWWAHTGWLFWPVVPPPGYRATTKLDNDAVVHWQSRWYTPIVVSGFVLPFLFAGWPGLWLAGFIRVVVQWHVTWAVNSVCHRWGEPARGRDGKILPSRDKSRNNKYVAYLTMGEGWHATHHADPNSYELGLNPGEPDGGRWFIDWLASRGLASGRQRFSR